MSYLLPVPKEAFITSTADGGVQRFWKRERGRGRTESLEEGKGKNEDREFRRGRTESSEEGEGKRKDRDF